MAADDLAAHEALIAFLYRAPIGLLQTRPDGEITMINPMATQLLMPLAHQGDLANLFDVLAPLAPGLRALAAGQPAPGSPVCDGLRLALPATAGQAPRTLALGITRIDGDTLMCCLSDVSHSVREEQRHLASRLRDQGRTDTLTGLPNRIVAQEHITHALAQQAEAGGCGSGGGCVFQPIVDAVSG